MSELAPGVEVRDHSVRALQMRSALDLLRRVPDPAPRRIADLRGAPGSIVSPLAQRFPEAEIVAIDLVRTYKGLAKRLAPQFPAPAEFDLAYSNGTLDMLPSLRRLLPELMSLIKAGGRLAIEIPNDLHEPYRVIARMLAVDGPWAAKLIPVAKTQPFNETMEDLYGLISSRCVSLDIWEATYLHPIGGVAAIVEWMRATALAPLLQPLDEGAQREFLVSYAAELKRAYPPQLDGTVLLRFPRLFLLAQR